MGITASRGGVTSSTWYETGIPVSVEESSGAVGLRLTLDSKGGGQTDVLVKIPPEDFEHLIKQMIAINPDKTIGGFGRVIAKKFK